MKEAQAKIFGGKVLAAGVAAGWLVTSEEIARFNPQTATLIIVAFVIVVFSFLSKTLYDRLAWYLAFQAFALQPLPIAGIYTSVPDIMLAFLVLEASLALQLRHQKFSPMGVLAIGLLVSTCVSVILSPVRSDILGPSVRYGMLLILFIALDRIEFPERALTTIRYSLALAFPLALILFYFNGYLADLVEGIAMGSTPHSQLLPFLLLLAFPWCVLDLRRTLALVLLACAFLGIAWATQTRGMIVTAFVAPLIVVAAKLKGNLSTILISVAVTVMALVSVHSVMGIEGVAQVMGSRPDSDDWRLYKMRLAMEGFSEHPVFGMGPGGEGATTRRGYGEDMVSENGLVQSLADSGLVGTTLFLAIVFYPLKRCFDLAKRRIIGRDFAGALMIMALAVLAPLSFASASEGGIVWLLLAIMNKHLSWAQSSNSENMQLVDTVPTDDSALKQRVVP